MRGAARVTGVGFNGARDVLKAKVARRRPLVKPVPFKRPRHVRFYRPIGFYVLKSAPWDELWEVLAVLPHHSPDVFCYRRIVLLRFFGLIL